MRERFLEYSVIFAVVGISAIVVWFLVQVLDLPVQLLTIVLLIATLVMLVFTVRLYHLSRVKTSCLRNGTKIDLPKNELRIKVRNESHTAKATLRAKLFVDGEHLKVKKWVRRDVDKFLRGELEEEDVIKRSYLYPQLPGTARRRLPWRVEIDPLDFRVFRVSPFRAHRGAAKRNEVYAKTRILASLDESKLLDEIRKMAEKAPIEAVLSRLREMEKESDKFAEELKRFEDKTGISLDWKNNMPNLLENALEPDWQEGETITVRIEQTGDEHRFEKSDGEWSLPSCTQIE